MSRPFWTTRRRSSKSSTLSCKTDFYLKNLIFGSQPGVPKIPPGTYITVTCRVADEPQDEVVDEVDTESEVETEAEEESE